MDLEGARALLVGAERVVVLTGAGISTDSGIPDFRGPQGVWTKNPEAEKTATLSHYLSDPEVRKRSWRNRLTSPYWSAEPNAGHRALVELERAGRSSLIGPCSTASASTSYGVGSALTMITAAPACLATGTSPAAG